MLGPLTGEAADTGAWVFFLDGFSIVFFPRWFAGLVRRLTGEAAMYIYIVCKDNLYMYIKTASGTAIYMYIYIYIYMYSI